MDRKSTLHDFAAGETGRGPGVPSSLTNNPRSGQWDGRRMSKRMIADYKTFIVTDGEGKIIYDGGEMEIKKADEIFLPAGVKNLRFVPAEGKKLEIVRCLPPDCV